jgi:Transposase
MGASRKYPLELRERAVRLVFESGRPVRQVARVSASIMSRCGCGCGRRRPTAAAGASC